MLNIEEDLKVVWSPSSSGRLSGEVRGKVIFIYEPDPGKAIEAVEHEVLDYLIAQPIEPLKKMLNKLIEMVNDDVYRRKERVVDKLAHFYFLYIKS